MDISGTQGYEEFADYFIQASSQLKFEQVCQDFIPFLPPFDADILDVGTGTGEFAMALAQMGHKVTGVEPVTTFLQRAITAEDLALNQHPIRWLKDHLPQLRGLDQHKPYDFILVNAVWHHLNLQERAQAMARISQLLGTGARCAMSLRNGPAGIGSRVFATDAQDTIKLAEEHGLNCIFERQQQGSFLPGKPKAFWSRLVLEKSLHLL